MTSHCHFFPPGGLESRGQPSVVLVLLVGDGDLALLLRAAVRERVANLSSPRFDVCYARASVRLPRDPDFDGCLEPFLDWGCVL